MNSSFAHPLHPDRPARDRTSEQRGIERGVVGAVVAVASRTFHVDADDVRRRDANSARNVRRATQNTP